GKQRRARTGRVGLDVRRRRRQRRDVRAEQPGLVVAEHDVRLGELRLAGAQALHLPSLELEAGFEILLDEEIEARLTVLRDGALRALLSLLPGHGSAMILECKTKNTSRRLPA